MAFNPVFHAFMIVEHSFVKLFINPHKLTAQIARKLDADDIKFRYTRTESRQGDTDKPP